MKLTVVGSGSTGNCYILQNDKEALIIEAGVPFKEVQQFLDFNISKILGVVITHEHGDHIKYVSDFQKRGIEVYATKGTLEAKNAKGTILEAGEITKLGNFKILPFEVKHDAAEPVGFFINHSEIGNLVFATDTYYLPNRFKNVSHWLIEANYRIDILNVRGTEGFSKVLRDRTLQSHLSYDNCVKALKANDLNPCKNIVLIHLSDRNSNCNEFLNGVKKEFGKPTYIAEKGLEINLSSNPF